MIALLALGQLLDVATLALVGAVRPDLLAYEQPVTRALLAAGGLAAVLLAKGLLVAAAALAARSRSAWGTRWRVALALVALSGFVGAAFNLGALA